MNVLLKFPNHLISYEMKIRYIAHNFNKNTILLLFFPLHCTSRELKTSWMTGLKSSFPLRVLSVLFSFRGKVKIFDMGNMENLKGKFISFDGTSIGKTNGIFLFATSLFRPSRYYIWMVEADTTFHYWQTFSYSYDNETLHDFLSNKIVVHIMVWFIDRQVFL